MSILEEKLELLGKIYQVFEEHILAEYQVACGKGCAACCTHHVTGTTLEAYYLLEALKRAGRTDLLGRLSEAARADIFRPRLTTNTMAMICLSRQEPPVEEPGPNVAACPLLGDNVCPVYEARPFGCRGMYSLSRCQDGLEAEIPPEMASIVTVCWQVIEHLDAGGLFGNVIDQLMHLMDDENAALYESGDRLIVRSLPPTRPVPGFLVPPQQAEAVQDFIDKLLTADCDGLTFRERMARMRDAPF